MEGPSHLGFSPAPQHWAYPRAAQRGQQTSPSTVLYQQNILQSASQLLPCSVGNEDLTHLEIGLCVFLVCVLEQYDLEMLIVTLR